MLISVEMACDYLGVTENNLTCPNTKYGKFYKHGKFDIDGYNEFLNSKDEYKTYILETVGLAEFVIKMLGEEAFYNKIPTLKRQYVKSGIISHNFSEAIAKLIRGIYEEEWLSDYLAHDPTVEIKSEYVPLEDRQPLTADYVMGRYWASKKTTLEIAQELNVPEFWIQKEIRRLGLQKKENGIIRKGRKGYKMPEAIKVKHQNQPHAKPIVQICPKTFITIREYTSQGAVERYGFNRENVRKAIKSGGLSKGFLWAFKDLAEVTVNVAKKRGTLTRKLQAYEYKKPSKKELEKLYILQNRTVEECAELYKCAPTTIAVLAGKYGLKKRTGKLDMSEVERLYLKEGLKASEIAKRTGRTTKTIATYLSKAGIKRC